MLYDNENQEVGRLARGRAKFDFSPFVINRVQGETLERYVRDQQRGGSIRFSKFYNCTTGEVSCIDWCRNVLAQIEIHIPKTGIPSVAVRGGCRIA